MSDTKIDDGGPAFPCETYGLKNGKETTIPTNGMTLRDWFAGQALAGLIAATVKDCGVDPSEDEIAGWAYYQAERMLAARKEKV